MVTARTDVNYSAEYISTTQAVSEVESRTNPHKHNAKGRTTSKGKGGSTNANIAHARHANSIDNEHKSTRTPSLKTHRKNTHNTNLLGLLAAGATHSQHLLLWRLAGGSEACCCRCCLLSLLTAIRAPISSIESSLHCRRVVHCGRYHGAVVDVNASMDIIFTRSMTSN